MATTVTDAAELRELMKVALRASELARDVIMPVYQREIHVELKADRTPVTVADRRAEEVIREFLERECPADGVLGEEYGEKAGDGHKRWILDPIDGTKSFIHKVPLWGTLIALEQDGRPVLGLIACHAVGETVVAAKGEGAFLNGSPCHVSAVAAVEGATVTMTSATRMVTELPKFAALCNSAKLTRVWGDCYGYMMVAAGRADVMIDPIMNLWDLAALYPVIQEAGGRISDVHGGGYPGESVVATNGWLHEAVLASLH